MQLPGSRLSPDFRGWGSLQKELALPPKAQGVSGWPGGAVALILQTFYDSPWWFQPQDSLGEALAFLMQQRFTNRAL